MSKPLKKSDKSNRSITDFFARQSSMSTPSSSQPPSSQPSSSQLTPSKKPGFKPGLRQVSKKTNATLSQDKGIISISSSSADDPVLVSAKGARSHISVSDDTSDSVVVVAEASKLKASASTKAPAAPKLAHPRQTQSSAKTTVKRRAQPAVTAGPSGTKPTTRRKRKLSWSDSSEDEMFKPDPNAMNASLTRAPVPRVAASPSKSAKGKAPADAPSSPSARSTSSKRRRISFRNLPAVGHASGEDADVEEVPSSVSDEQELMLPPKSTLKDPEVIKNNVDKWLETSIESSSHEHSPPPSDYPSTSPTSSSPAHEIVALPVDQLVEVEADMDVNMASAADVLVGNGTPQHSGSEAEVNQQLCPQESSSSLSSIPTHPYTPRKAAHEGFDPFANNSQPHTPTPAEVADLPPLPPTPVALDAETKTRQWIERVKAEALEAARREQQRDSDDEVSLPSLSDSDDDDDMLFPAALKNTRTSTPPPRQSADASSPLSAVPSSPAVQSEAGPSARYSFRRREPAQDKKRRPSSLDSDAERPRPGPSRKPGANPLDKLLREKKMHEKSGKGMEGVRLAEAVMRDEHLMQKNKGKLLEEMEREVDSDNDMWADERTAMEVVRQGSHKSGFLPSNPVLEDEDSDSDEPADLDIAEATKHLGDEQGEAVGKILTKDRKGWLLKGRSKKRSAKGVPLWQDLQPDPESVMEDDLDDFVPLPFSEDEVKSDCVLSLLNSAVTSGDILRLSCLLTVQLLSQSTEAHRPGLVRWLFSLGLSKDEDVSEQAYACLVGLAARTSTPCSLCEPLVSCLRELGAKSKSLEAYDLSSHDGGCKRAFSAEARSRHVSRIVHAVKAFAEGSVVNVEDIPNVIMALLLIGFDPSSSAELRSEIMITVDILASLMPSSSAGYSDMEPALCLRILQFAEEMTPVNKAFLMTFFCGSSPQVARLVRWLSQSLLLGDRAFKDPYCSLPALEPVVDLLSPVTGSKAMFDVVGGAEEDGYFDDLLCYVAILNYAFNDVPAYVQEEKKLAATGSEPIVTGGAPTSPEKPKSELQRIKRCLEVLHGKIVDTRAAHLDRSRVKAALQQLSFRIHYTREAALKWSHSPRPAGLRAYFRRPAA